MNSDSEDQMCSGNSAPGKLSRYNLRDAVKRGIPPNGYIGKTFNSKLSGSSSISDTDEILSSPAKKAKRGNESGSELLPIHSLQEKNNYPKRSGNSVESEQETSSAIILERLFFGPLEQKSSLSTYNPWMTVDENNSEFILKLGKKEERIPFDLIQTYQ
jgi:hypothetical protein